MKKLNPFKVRKSRDRIQSVPSRPAPKPKQRPVGSPKSTRVALVRKYIENQRKIEEYKSVMAEQDTILECLINTGTDGTDYIVVDAFAGEASAWKSVCFRRYELVRRGGK